MELRIPLPKLDGGLVTNLAALAGLILVVVAIGALSDWRWAMLAGGVLTFAVAVWAQRQLPGRSAALPDNVRPHKKAA